jgi:hypothetical protein
MSRPDRTTDLLLLAGKVIAIFMQGAMALGAAALLIALPFVTLFSGELAEGFADGSKIPLQEIPTFPFAAVILIGLGIVAALFVFFGRLRAIINTVGDGDPFVPVNAERLSLMAWLILGVHALAMAAVPFALQLAQFAERFGEEAEINIDGGFDLSGILLVIILFILARVFRHGAEMREDLEGTV